MTREDVINKVTAIVADMQEEVDEWKDYSDSELRGGLTCDCDWWYKTLQTLKDALALLKAQEPRVMTLEEVRDEAEYMFLEKHSETGSDLYGCAIRGDWDGYGIELLMSEYDTARERWSDYGKTWRCWTSRPSDEQRKAVAWE